MTISPTAKEKKRSTTGPKYARSLVKENAKRELKAPSIEKDSSSGKDQSAQKNSSNGQSSSTKRGFGSSAPELLPSVCNTREATARNDAQQASEAILVQRLMLLLRSDIGGGASAASSTLSMISASTEGSMVSPASSAGFGRGNWWSRSQSLPGSSNPTMTLIPSPRSAGASLCSSGSISPEQPMNPLLGQLPLFGPSEIASQASGTTTSLSFDEALKAIREKMVAARKKKAGIDPHAQLAIVKGILQLAAMAAECTGALIAMPMDGDDDHDQSADNQERWDTQASAINSEKLEGQGCPVSAPLGSDLLRIDLTAPAEVLRAEGMHLLKRLASGGSGRNPLPEAQCFLAQLLRGHGDQRLGIKINMDRAFSLSLQASKHGLSEAIFWTALSYERGMGVRKDATRAVTFHRKAAILGHGRAMHRLAIILQQGQLGMTQAPKEAFTWLKRAASIGSIPGAIHDLALMFEQGNGSGIAIPDDSYALELFKKASAMRYAPSMVKLGTCFEYGRLGCPLDPRQSIEWYRRAAELEDPAAELALSGWYLTGAKEVNSSNPEGDGIILPQSDQDAYAWAKRAAERRDPRAEYALGRYCELGVGLDAPALQEALHWYSRAALQGHRKAKRRRAELKKSIRFSSSADLSTSSSSIRFVKSLLSGGRWGS